MATNSPVASAFPSEDEASISSMIALYDASVIRSGHGDRVPEPQVNEPIHPNNVSFTFDGQTIEMPYEPERVDPKGQGKPSGIFGLNSKKPPVTYEIHTDHEYIHVARAIMQAFDGGKGHKSNPIPYARLKNVLHNIPMLANGAAYVKKSKLNAMFLPSDRKGAF